MRTQPWPLGSSGTLDSISKEEEEEEEEEEVSCH